MDDYAIAPITPIIFLIPMILIVPIALIIPIVPIKIRLPQQRRR